jgi:hypothetical protein
VRLLGFPGKNKQPAKKKAVTVKIAQKTIVAGVSILALAVHCLAQTNLQFTSVNATPEGAIQLHWVSIPNAIYEIDYADSLRDRFKIEKWAGIRLN